MSYRYIPEDQKANYPPRIQEIVDEYERNSLEFILDLDNREYADELLYEKWAKQNPDKTWMEVLSIHRLRDEYNNKEYLIAKLKKYAMNNKGEEISAEVWYGKKPKFTVSDIRDDDGNIVNRTIRRWNMVYTVPWDKKEFDRLMKESRNKRVPTYVAYTSDEYHQNWSGNPIMIKNDQLFKDASFDELLGYDERIKTDRLTNQIHQAAGKPNVQ